MRRAAVCTKNAPRPTRPYAASAPRVCAEARFLKRASPEASMNEDDDDGVTAASEAPGPALDAEDESEVARRAGTGDQQAFDLLYDRYFARTSWYFMTIFP